MNEGGDDDEALARRLQEEEDLAAIHEADAAEAAALALQNEPSPPPQPQPQQTVAERDPVAVAPPPAAHDLAQPNLASLLDSFQASFTNHVQHMPVAPASAAGARRVLFDRKYQAYSRLVSGIASMDEATFEHGDKILLPPSALQELSGRNLLEASQDGGGPTLFRLGVRRHNASSTAVFGGVLEFSAPHGCAVVPSWMMAHLGVEDGDAISVQQVQLPKATYCRLRPINFGDFKQLESHRAVLEATLRGYFTLTKGATISVLFDDVEYILEVTDVGPAGEAVCIVNADIETEFDLPEEYFETPHKKPMLSAPQQQHVDWSASVPASSGIAVGSAGDDTPKEGFRRCDSCRRNVPEASFARHAAFCERNLFVCPECGDRMPKSQEEAHFAKTHAPAECDLCGAVCPIDMMATHKDFTCEMRKCLCEYCQLSFVASKIEAHSAGCGARTERCDDCGAYVMKRHMADHANSGCQFRAPEREPSRPGTEAAVVRGGAFEFACHMCGTEFETMDDLGLHVSTAHDDSGGNGHDDDDAADQFRADASSAESISDLEQDNAPSPLSLSLSDE